MGVTAISPSSIAAFKECPLAFKFSYVERLPEPPSAAASKGTLVHKALELLMRREPADRTRDAALADLTVAWQLLESDPEFPHVTGARMVSALSRDHAAQPRRLRLPLGSRLAVIETQDLEA